MTITHATTTAGRDAHGNTLSADAETVRRYDLAIDRLVRFHPDVVALAGDLMDTDDPVPMSAALTAYLHLGSTDRADLATVQACLAAMTARPGNAREQAHVAAISAWAAGDWHGAAAALEDLLVRWPTDVLALVYGHQLDFFVGDATALRDRPLRALVALDPEHPHAPFVAGMAAFGLEEAGHHERARATGLAAVEANPDDVWAIHAVTHTYEMQGLVDEGIAFLRSDRTRWESGNLFTVHNWWHLALFLLEAGRTDEVLDIYDREIHHAGSEDVPIELLDASALLWRLHLDGVDVGDRWDRLADAWAPGLDEEPWYAFNDLHLVLALVGAGRLTDARARIERLSGWLPTARGSNAAMTSAVGLPACRAALAFAEDRHDDVVATLHPIRRSLHRFGGSHAQRDVLQRTLLEATQRAGRHDLAEALTAERVGFRDTSVHGWSQRARALRSLGRTDDAATADQRAAEHRARFARAADR